MGSLPVEIVTHNNIKEKDECCVENQRKSVKCSRSKVYLTQ